VLGGTRCRRLPSVRCRDASEGEGHDRHALVAVGFRYDYDMTANSVHPLATEFAQIGVNSPPSERVQAACRAYTAATGHQVGWPMTLSESAQIRMWLIRESLDTSVAMGWYKTPVLQPWVHADVAAKAVWLQQAPCMQCRLIPLTGNPPFPVSFPIPVRPFTKQNRKTRQLLTEATRKELTRRSADRQPMEAWNEIGICASVVAIQARPAKIIDVDNAAKAILDTMKGIIFPDDRQIQHLSVSRIRHSDTLAYYLIMLRPVHAELEDVIDPTCCVKFGGLVQPIDV